MPRTLRISLLLSLLVPFSMMRAQMDAHAAVSKPSSEAKKVQEEIKTHNDASAPAIGVNQKRSLLPKKKIGGASDHPAADKKNGLEKYQHPLSDTKGTHIELSPSDKGPAHTAKDSKREAGGELELGPYDLGCGDPKLSEIQKKKCREQKKADDSFSYKK